MSENKAADQQKKSISDKELDVLNFWKSNDIFEKSLEKEVDGVRKQNFSFYDGPPFATGVPHHGHILAGTMKDIIPRYRTMKGDYVRRVWGWDCHGLPIENLIEKELNLNHKKEIEEYGLDKFNQACFDSVLRYEKEWKEIVPRVGRWVDMNHPYKTMDASYTESIWWSWKELFERGLAYEGYKVMHICPRCETTLAQSEVAQGYKDVTDISLTAKFELVDEPGTFLLAWTTTPWTLPGNTALAVNLDADYVKVSYFDMDMSAVRVRDVKHGEPSIIDPITINSGIVILAKDTLEKVLKGKQFEIIEEVKGSDLVGKKYIPVFDYYKNAEISNRQNIYKVWAGDFVTLDTGTGIVHIAPAFGTDDMNLAKANQIPVIHHVKMDGQFTKEVEDFQGVYVKKLGDTQSTDIEIIKNLAHRGKLFSKEKIVHSYPHCWRCDTPLLNYATSSWFVNVLKIKSKVLEANKEVRWVPEHIQEGRFGKWLENAHDWAVSRSRYWGAPIPVWKSPDGDIKIIGSFNELREYLPEAKNTYYGIRHGQSKSNVRNVLDTSGDPENHLTQKGVAEATSLSAEIQSLGITRIISSPFVRTLKTAKIVSDKIGVPVEIDERLRESNLGDWDGKTVEELYFDNKEFGTNLAFAPKNGESHLDIRKRVMNVLFDCEKKYQGEKVLIVTHGGPLWMLLTGAKMLNESETFSFVGANRDSHIGGHGLPNAGLNKIDFKPFPNRDGVLDVHRPFIDEVKLTINGKEYKRIPDVFDCWYESGSMPYAEIHYPFENKQLFDDMYPADWIGEGLDQTRGWFYSLMILGVALFGASPYKNVIVNGLVLAADGQKMSKSKKNFTDPLEIVQKYGADTLRLYLVSSPLVEAENTNFVDKELEEMHRRIFVRLENVLAFYEMFKDEIESRIDAQTSANVLDQWIINRLYQVIDTATSGLDSFELDTAARPFDAFVDDLSVWYVRRSRERLKGETGDEDRVAALSTLEFVLQEFAKVFAPFAPFVSDRVYRSTNGNKQSVHLDTWPKKKSVDEDSIEEMKRVREVVSKGLDARVKNKIKVRQPLSSLTTGVKIKKEYLHLIEDEVNVKEVSFNFDLNNDVVLDLTITEELKQEGDVRELIRAVQDLRKSAGLTPNNQATLTFSGDERVKAFIESVREIIMRACVLSDIRFDSTIEAEEILLSDYSLKVTLA